MEYKKIKSFTDLKVWREAHKLVLMIYKVTEKFPKSKIYGLTNQIRRSAVSIASNIAEGFARNTLKDKIRFYYMSKGSNSELQCQLLISRNLKFITKKEFSKIADQSVLVSKYLTASIKKLKKY